MQATAKLSGYRQAPRKVRLIAGLIRGKSVEIALVELNHRAKRAAPVFAKLILSAVANAKALGMSVDTLIVKEVRVDKGAVLKRSRPRAQGRAFPIHKHTSHIMLTLTEKTAEVKTAKAKKEAKTTEEKPAKKVTAKKVVAKKAVKK
jgi:large subunit ribosomal protein L22